MTEVYDESYYNGGKGAYQRYEYSVKWENRAAGLLAAFPDATSFLDIGCARGFLLRGYVENGIPVASVYGVDMSQFAIENADDDIKEQVECCSIFDFKPQRQWDLVTAYDLLEHLPMEQLKEAVSILEGACSKHLHVMLMTERAEWDTDLTHVSIQPLEAWTDLFSFELVDMSRMSKSPHVTMATFRRVE